MRCVLALVASLALAGCAAHAAPSHLGAGPITAPQSDVEQAAARGGQSPHVTAESRYGHGRVSGPVRQLARGRLEVRSPGGSWYDCGRSCSETLRRETIDFWESRGGKNDVVDGPAYFSWGW
jgi:hypothetical protein